MTPIELKLKAAARRMPGPDRSDAEQAGPHEARALIAQGPSEAAEVAGVLSGFLLQGDTDEARLAAYLVDEVPLESAALLAGYERTDIPVFERSKLAWKLGARLLAGGLPYTPKVRHWVKDPLDAPAFWAAYFVHDRQVFERDAPQLLPRDPGGSANQLWFAVTQLADADYQALVQSLTGFQAQLGSAWLLGLLPSLEACRPKP